MSGKRNKRVLGVGADSSEDGDEAGCEYREHFGLEATWFLLGGFVRQ